MVVFPTSTEDVVKIVKIAVKYRMPVVPFSGGTSLEGHYLAVSRAFRCGSVREGLTERMGEYSPLWVASV